ncbi:MAG: sulfatase-like hydrolase/transferase, partial [Desulforhopalus sp.]
MFVKKMVFAALSVSTALLFSAANGLTAEIVHDDEFLKLQAQHGEKWKAEDVQLDKKLAELKAKYSKRPNIIHLMWDDSGYGDVGSPLLTRIHGIDTPNIAKMADEGISFTRMYTEPSCTPTRAATLTGRHPV